MAKKEIEIEGKINEVIIHEHKRADGTVSIAFDYQFCPTMTEQHSAHMTDLNYLIAKYKPDELAAYIAARNEGRQEIIGHDFSKEPDFADAKNIVYQMRKSFDELSDDVKKHFASHVEFLKFIDNPANQEKMLKLGLMTKKEIEKVKTPEPPQQTTNQTTNTEAVPS